MVKGVATAAVAALVAERRREAASARSWAEWGRRRVRRAADVILIVSVSASALVGLLDWDRGTVAFWAGLRDLLVGFDGRA